MAVAGTSFMPARVSDAAVQGSKPALTGGVDDEEDLSAKLLEGDGAAIEQRSGEPIHGAIGPFDGKKTPSR